MGIEAGVELERDEVDGALDVHAESNRTVIMRPTRVRMAGERIVLPGDDAEGARVKDRWGDGEPAWR